MNIDFINTIIKTISIILITMYIFSKLINYKYKIKEKIYIIIMSILGTMLYIFIKDKIDSALAILIIYFSLSFLISKLTKNPIGYSMIAVLLSMALCIISLVMAVVVAFVFKPLLAKIGLDILYILLITIIQIIIIVRFFKIRRFSKGISFFQHKENGEHIDIIVINISAIVILIYCLFGNYYGNLTRKIFCSFLAIRNYYVYNSSENFNPIL